MKRPKKPKKPLKSEPKPSIEETHYFYLYETEEGYKLLKADQCEPPDDLTQDDANMWQYDFYDTHSVPSEPYAYWEVQEWAKYIPADGWTFCPVRDRDGYVTALEIEYDFPKPKAQHAQEVYEWETRFDRYEAELEVWEKEMEKYNEYKKQQKIAKLQKELEELENE